MDIQPLELFHKGIVIVRGGSTNDKYHRLAPLLGGPSARPNFELRTDYQDNYEQRQSHLAEPNACFKMQPIDFICVGNVIKYVCCCDQKNGLEDLKKGATV
ncbi:hypothetical protein BH10PSE6_BH10PSE6_29740 [soil metagenome]